MELQPALHEGTHLHLTMQSCFTPRAACRAMELVKQFKAIDCATMLMGFAKLRYRPRGDGRELMELLVEHTLHLVQVSVVSRSNDRTGSDGSNLEQLKGQVVMLPVKHAAQQPMKQRCPQLFICCEQRTPTPLPACSNHCLLRQPGRWQCLGIT